MRRRPAEVPLGPPPRISVVVPCYNYARFLPEAVGSALAQPHVDVDVVIVDDASTDDSAAVAQALAARDPRVRVVRHDRNRGHVETANEALGYATGEFLVKLDADDALTPGALARAAAVLTRHRDMAFCYGWAEEFHDRLPAHPPTRVRTWSVWDGEQWIARVLRRGHNVIRQPEVVVRRTAVQRTGGYRPQLRWAEDLNWWLRLACTGSVGRVNGATQGLYRVHPGSFQRSARDIELTDLRARIAAVELFFAECAPQLADPAGLAADAYAALGREAERDAARHPGVAEYARIAVGLRARHGVAARRSPATSDTRAGALYRDLEDRWRWRRWRRYGT